jgi:hypothetical protein
MVRKTSSGDLSKPLQQRSVSINTAKTEVCRLCCGV